MRKLALAAVLTGLILSLYGPQTLQPVTAKSYDVGTEDAAQFIDSQVVASPSPKIPDDMQEDGYKSSVLARFSVAADGKTKVKLLTSSGSADIDELTLDTLKKWTFKPATLDGKPVSSSRKIKVEFEVQ